VLLPAHGHPRVTRPLPTRRSADLARTEVTDWPGYGIQKNRALARATREWALAIDADEHVDDELAAAIRAAVDSPGDANGYFIRLDRKSTRLNSSHCPIPYAVFSLQ